MDYSASNILEGAKILAQRTFGQKSQYDIKFNKEDDGLWYVDYPNWPFSHHNLQMVAGADDLCEFLSNGKNYAKVSVEPENTEREGAQDYIRLERTSYHTTRGAFYDVYNLDGFNKNIWLCPVTLFVLGRYPKYMYVKNLG